MEKLKIGSRTFQSRLIVGSGKYKDLQETADATKASEAEIITLAIRRMNIGQSKADPNILDFIDPNQYTLLPNTAGCYDADSAVRTCLLAQELLDGHNFIKLEVIGDEKTLYPNVRETIKAAEELLKRDFEVLAYTTDDPIIAKNLEEVGCAAVMPLASPIGSGMGIQNEFTIRTIVENSNIPIIVDAGIGTASDASKAMELGCDAVLVNSAIAKAKNPLMMAEAMAVATRAGRLAFLAGRMEKMSNARPSSPIEGKID
ncbi:MAG: thiazole synthase [Pseudomonadota bacterium]|nr:thiazole synthase [Pseudomonadota bacterium]